MAINIINSQGTKTYITDIPDPEWADCSAAVTEFHTNGKEVGCPQSIGALEETRGVTEYKCLNTDETAKALGTISRGNMEIGLLFDPDDTAGQKALKDAWAANSFFRIGIELSNMPDGGTNGTLFWFEGAVSSVSTGIVADEAVTYTVTVEITSEITECPAA